MSSSAISEQPSSSCYQAGQEDYTLLGLLFKESVLKLLVKILVGKE